MVDWTKPVETEDGRKCRVVCTDRKDSVLRVIVLVDCDGCESVSYAMEDGRTCDGSGRGFRNVPEKFERTVWVNVYPDDEGIPRDTKERADQVATKNRIARIKTTITGTVGQFDE